LAGNAQDNEGTLEAGEAERRKHGNGGRGDRWGLRLRRWPYAAGLRRCRSYPHSESAGSPQQDPLPKRRLQDRPEGRHLHVPGGECYPYRAHGRLTDGAIRAQLSCTRLPIRRRALWSIPPAVTVRSSRRWQRSDCEPAPPRSSAAAGSRPTA
jgi:hypothetical protein